MLVFDYVDDETCDIRFNGKLLLSVNHDEDGWAGMERAIQLAKNFAAAINAPILENGDPCV